MDAKQLAKSLNGLRAAMAAGMSFGPSNEAKIASKVAQAIEAGYDRREGRDADRQVTNSPTAETRGPA